MNGVLRGTLAEANARIRELETENRKLRKIAAHVTALAYLHATEAAGFAVAVRATGEAAAKPAGWDQSFEDFEQAAQSYSAPEYQFQCNGCNRRLDGGYPAQCGYCGCPTSFPAAAADSAVSLGAEGAAPPAPVAADAKHPHSFNEKGAES